METLRSYIAGEWVDGTGPTWTVTNPARPTDELWVSPGCSTEQALGALAAASEAFKMWRRSPATFRAEILQSAATFLRDHSDAVSRDICLEEGKTRAEAVAETTSAIRSLEYFAGQASNPVGEVLPRSDTAEMIWTVRVPLGAVVCITPWNFPLLIPTYKTAAALATGNTVILKPAELTPRSAEWLARALDSAGAPSGIFNLCQGRGDIAGAALLDGEPAAVSFTGSTSVGRAIGARLAARGIPVQLEMGGKNPAIVLDDADIARASAVIVRAAMGMAGQRCTAVSRVITTPGSRTALAEALTQHVAAIRVGDPLDAGTGMGPLTSRNQYDKVAAARDEAMKHSRVLVEGNAPDRDGLPGWFLPPIVFTDVDPGSQLAQEEVFGPILAVIDAADVSEALRIANATRYGLTASVFTESLATALEAIDILDVGVIHVNRHTFDIERYAPFGGMKDSGYGGREQGQRAREFFTETKTVYVATAEDHWSSGDPT